MSGWLLEGIGELPVINDKLRLVLGNVHMHLEPPRLRKRLVRILAEGRRERRR